MIVQYCWVVCRELWYTDHISIPLNQTCPVFCYWFMTYSTAQYLGVFCLREKDEFIVADETEHLLTGHEGMYPHVSLFSSQVLSCTFIYSLISLSLHFGFFFPLYFLCSLASYSSHYPSIIFCHHPPSFFTYLSLYVLLLLLLLPVYHLTMFSSRIFLLLASLV